MDENTTERMLHILKNATANWETTALSVFNRICDDEEKSVDAILFAQIVWYLIQDVRTIKTKLNDTRVLVSKRDDKKGTKVINMEKHYEK